MWIHNSTVSTHTVQLYINQFNFVHKSTHTVQLYINQFNFVHNSTYTVQLYINQFNFVNNIHTLIIQGDPFWKKNLKLVAGDLRLDKNLHSLKSNFLK